MAETVFLQDRRRWQCVNCAYRFEGPTSQGCSWRWCPICKASSRGIHATDAEAPSEGYLIVFGKETTFRGKQMAPGLYEIVPLMDKDTIEFDLKRRQ